jgi:hypothetical protein
MKLKALILGAAFSAGSLFANTVTMHNTPFDGIVDAGGGEYKAVTDNNGTFLTFCLEAQVHVDVNFNTLYSYTISNRAFAGGGDKHDPTGPGSGPDGDPISQGTAWLYTQFVKGTLVDSDGVGNYNNENHDLNAGLLQKAIWALEDENFYTIGTNYYANLALTHGGFATYTGTDVKVMNLWTISQDHVEDVQSMLVYVPDSGMTVALLGLGLLSLAAFRRKL